MAARRVTLAAPRRPRRRPVVAQAPVGLPVRPALLGRGAAPADHPRAAARDAGARAPASACSRSDREPATTRSTSPAGSATTASWSCSTSSRRCSTTPWAAPASAASPTSSRPVATRPRSPSDDDSFDAVVLTAVLGEIPDQDAALREIARVLRPDGRLVVGELFGDPHFTAPGALERRAEAAGLRLEHRNGPVARLLRAADRACAARARSRRPERDAPTRRRGAAESRRP